MTLRSARKPIVDKAVAAARRAVLTYSQTSREERIALLGKIIEIYKGRMKDIGAAVSDEMGAPLPMAERPAGRRRPRPHRLTLEVLKNYSLSRKTSALPPCYASRSASSA
jgi:aldehyde dehydrogenase (NAD+)